MVLEKGGGGLAYEKGISTNLALKKEKYKNVSPIN